MGHRIGRSRRLLPALVLFAIATFAVGEAAVASTRQYSVAPAPDWVEPMTLSNHGRLPRNPQGDRAYLLVDRQFRVKNGWSAYRRYVSEVVNPAGVEDASQLTIDFDPQLDHLILHAVKVRRGNEVINELRHGRIEVLHRESELEQGILDGSLTFHLLMSNVRVGDMIDVSYTIEHHEPALGNRFFERVTTRWDEPVAHSRLRVLIPEKEPLFVGGTEPSAPVKERKRGWQILEWNWNALPGVVADDDAPSWYQQYPAIQFSQFPNWGSVVRASLPLYSFNTRDPELAALVEHLKSSAKTQSGRALAAVRFVQEKIRYTGLELGSGAFRPRPPGEVLRSRYGDCKDKSLLAVALLRAMGFDAAPALVSTRWRGHLDEQLPSAGDFDHAIVRLRLEGKTYWIDVTETAQGGVLETLQQADFGKSLVISPGVTTLEPIAPQVPAQPLVTASAVFDLRAGLSAEGSYTISTVYRGSEADGLRSRLRRTSAAELGEGYLNYYKGRYPEIRAAGPPVIHDDPLANVITVNEAYRIAHPFESRPGERRFELEPEIIEDFAQKPRQVARNAPLELDYPVNVAEQIRIRLPRYFPIKDEVVKIDHPTFRYESRVSHLGNDVLFDAQYRTLADEVPRNELERFVDRIEDVRQDGMLQFTSSDPSPHEGTRTRTVTFVRADAGVGVPSMLTLAVALAFGIWCGWRVFRYDPTPERARENAPSGIRGFLVLQAIAVSLAPLVILFVLAVWLMLSNSRVWQGLGATSYRPWCNYAYLILLAAICVQLVVSFVSAVLFFSKRSSAPGVIVAIMWFGWFVSLGMELFGSAIGIHSYSLTKSVADASEQLIAVVLWSLYLLRSQRVKATFISRRLARVSHPSR
jgi:transglutaminase-like putative cysteine protease